LSKFKQQISDNLKKDYREVFDLHCPDTPDIEDSTKDEIKRIRDKFIAHVDEDSLLEGFGINLETLSGVRIVLIRYFDKMSFPPRACYMPGFQKKADEFVKMLAEKEPAINEPENHPMVWTPEALRMRNITEHEIEKMNKWRERLGKPPVGGK
jgi:hypothetical protein